MNQTWENGKKSNFGSNFALFGPNLGLKTFFVDFTSTSSLDIVPRYYPMLFKGKLMNKTWENSEKPNFGPNFDPNLGPQIFL